MKYHPIVEKIKSLLLENNAFYETFEHEPVRTSEEAAQVRTGYTLSQGAKALILRVKQGSEKKFIMLVISGDKKFDKNKVKNNLDSKDIRFATEGEVAEITDGVQVGGVPPFGNLFGLSVYTDPGIFTNEKIIFNAGDRRYSIGMKAEDYNKIVKPTVIELV